MRASSSTSATTKEIAIISQGRVAATAQESARTGTLHPHLLPTARAVRRALTSLLTNPSSVPDRSVQKLSIELSGTYLDGHSATHSPLASGIKCP
jgi:hypothetical protein